MTLYGEGSNASSTNKASDLSQSSGEQRTRTLRRERHAHEGSNASSTDSELWRVENSYLRMSGSSDAQKGEACS